jgi:hypothetical protein
MDNANRQQYGKTGGVVGRATATGTLTWEQVIPFLREHSPPGDVFLQQFYLGLQQVAEGNRNTLCIAADKEGMLNVIPAKPGSVAGGSGTPI